MLKRVRTMRVSLAAKCQMLFGMAVLLILAAALFVPWQRMEQLTDQLNERSARTLIDYAVETHIATVKPPTTRPMRAMSLALPPTTRPLKANEPMPAPRLILTLAGSDDTELTLFERRAVRSLSDHRDRDSYAKTYESEDGIKGFRFARADNRCVQCHVDPGAAAITNADAPATQPATRPAHAKVMGIVSVDIPSQIETSALLLNRVFILTAGMLAGTLAI